MRILLVTVALVLFMSSSVRGQSADVGEASRVSIVSIRTEDPLELSRWLSLYGDTALLEALSPRRDDPPSEESGTEVHELRRVAAAVVATPYMDAPELALSRLANLVAGRDPDLASRASLALVRIAESLTSNGLLTRETGCESVRLAVARLESVVQDSTVRRDLKQLIELSVVMFEDCCPVPSS